MSTRFFIPAGAVIENKSGKLDLVFPPRCSRCDAAEAPRFETHTLKYQAGMVRRSSFRTQFRTTVKFDLRLPLCEACYGANFIEDPDSCVHDQTLLGKYARRRSAGILGASIVAGAAFLLLMKIIPLPETWLWLILMGAALLAYALTLADSARQNRQIRAELKRKKPGEQLYRAEITAKMQLDDPQNQDTAVTATLQNEQWAEECAAHYGWICELTQLEAK